MEQLAMSALIGIGATVFMDLWEWALLKLFGLQRRNYAMMGRWIGHVPKGQVLHRPIMQSAAIGGEWAMGQILHYAIGALFGICFGVLLGAFGLDPLVLALGFGVATVVFPLFVMQPVFGLGFAGSSLVAPWPARLRSLEGHLSFGVGLFLAYRLIALI